MMTIFQIALLLMLAFAVLGIVSEAKAIRFRENIQIGDRCSFWMDGDWYPGEIVNIADETVTISYLGEFYERPLNQIEPLFPNFE